MHRTCDIDGCERKHVARGMCGTHYNRTRYTEAQRHPKKERACCVCGTVVLRRIDGQREGKWCCSVECRTIRQWGSVAMGPAYSWNRDAIKRAREYGARIVEDVDRLIVMERDGWKCYLCGVDTDRLDQGFSLTSATVDHVIALSRGGEHSYANTRCACLSCNASKAANEDATAA